MLRSEIPSYFKDRRDALMGANPGVLFLFPANREFLRNPDVHYPFRQESNFYYLSGFEEPESFLVLAPKPSTSQGYESILFVRERDPLRELWDGERYGVERAQALFHVDAVYPVTEFDAKFRDCLRFADSVGYRLGIDSEMDQRILGHLEGYRKGLGRSGRGILPLRDVEEVLGEMRLFKSPEEAAHLREAGRISALAHRKLMEELRPGMNEAEAEALINYELRRNGCGRVGYGSIVAGGKNSTCLHYTSNNEELRDGDLLLVDAGGEYEYYTADITRTFPVGRTFTKKQAEIYDLVLKAQKEAIALARPGERYEAVHHRAVEVLTDGLLSLGILKGKLDEVITSAAYRKYYPHNTGHWLGMDVHDVGPYWHMNEKREKVSRILKPGMVFTVEPGLYFQTYEQDAPEAYRGIGIRIEDDILVTEKGCENLTSGVPKERDELEALRAKAY